MLSKSWLKSHIRYKSHFIFVTTGRHNIIIMTKNVVAQNNVIAKYLNKA